MFVKAPERRPNPTTPITIRMIQNIYSKLVLPLMSPYPTVVIVVTVK
jgi:hypothetical protein